MCMLFLAAKDGFSCCREVSYILQRCFIFPFQVIIESILCPDTLSFGLTFEHIAQPLVYETSFAIVRKLYVQHVDHFLPQFGGEYRGHSFDPAVEIAAHPVR